nr:pantoate--beta-alanine ligase [Pseudoclavibacter sp. Marseille-Q3772]
MTELLTAAAASTLADRTELGRIALVPTMGALHDGHLALINLAKEQADTVVVSIFVNPLQFGPDEDYERYPRPFDHDMELLEQAGVDYCLHPDVDEMYPNWPATTVISAGEAGRILEGAYRPGHFDGVLTVVAKLFNCVHPDLAVFGEKDAQQLALIQRMARELLIPVEIVAHPIVREHDGLARSSRNTYLDGADRVRALVLSQALAAAAQVASAETGEHTLAKARAAAEAVYESQPLVTMDYLQFVARDTFTPIDSDYRGDVLALTAARVGTTRLIDNRSMTFR